VVCTTSTEPDRERLDPQAVSVEAVAAVSAIAAIKPITALPLKQGEDTQLRGQDTQPSMAMPCGDTVK
jgi:hypothetical protein